MEKAVSVDGALDLIGEKYIKLKPESRAALKECARIEVFERNTILVKAQQYSKALMFMITGALRAYYSKDGKDISDWFAFENDFICEINSFYLDKPSDHYFETLERSTIMIIPKESILKLCDQYHDVESLARQATTKTMIGLQRRVVSLKIETALQKYNNLLMAYPDITQRVSLGHIASFLGITLETLSRIRNPKNSR
jgi:CRP-like cAMP-binding protein